MHLYYLFVIILSVLFSHTGSSSQQMKNSVSMWNLTETISVLTVCILRTQLPTIASATHVSALTNVIKAWLGKMWNQRGNKKTGLRVWGTSRQLLLGQMKMRSPLWETLKLSRLIHWGCIQHKSLYRTSLLSILAAKQSLSVILLESMIHLPKHISSPVPPQPHHFNPWLTPSPKPPPAQQLTRPPTTTDICTRTRMTFICGLSLSDFKTPLSTIN